MAMNVRSRLTRAITKSINPDTPDQPPSDFQIKLVTGSYSDETCALMLAAEHTEFEESVILLASSFISSDELMQAFIRACPTHDGYGQVVMVEYFKELDRYRHAAGTGSSYEGSQLEKLLHTANKYMNHTGAPCLPSTTDDEHRIIALAQVHPSLIETLADHIGAQSLDSGLLDSFYNNPAPSLSEGIL
jgi:hypothetical protein